MGVTQLDIVESPVGSSFTYPTKTLEYFKNVFILKYIVLDSLPTHPLGSSSQSNIKDMQGSYRLYLNN